MLVIEKYMNVLDKLYRCFILHCLYNWFREKNEVTGRSAVRRAFILPLFLSAPVREGFDTVES